MPKTDYRFDKIHSGRDYTNRAGELRAATAPALRVWVGKNSKLVDIALTEQNLTDIITQCAGILAVQRIERERDTARAAELEDARSVAREQAAQ